MPKRPGRVVVLIMLHMNSHIKVPDTRHRYTGLEWVLLQLLPVLGLLGIVVPAAVAWGLHQAWDGDESLAQQLRMADFWVIGFMVVFWSLLMTVTVGCVLAWVVRRKRLTGPRR